MSWVRLDDGFPDHPKVVQAGPMAGWLYVCGLAYCARQLTDGFIPAAQLRKLVATGTVTKLAERLVEADLWERAAGGYRVHDYLQYNPTRQQTLALRKQKADAGRAGGKQNASRVLEGRFESATAPVPTPSSSPVGLSQTIDPAKETDTGGKTHNAAGRVREHADTAIVPINGAGSPQRDLLMAAGIAFGHNGQTESERRKERLKAHELVKADPPVTPDELPELVREYRRRGWPNVSLAAIASNLSALRSPAEPGRRADAGRDEPRGFDGIREAFADLAPSAAQ